MNNKLFDYFNNSASVIKNLEGESPTIERIANGIYENQLAGGKLLIAGNGGSCADAEHFAGELTCTFKNRNRRGFSAISLSSSSAGITAWSNDFGYESFFSRQVESIGSAGDILFLISTGGGDVASGASMNLVHAAQMAARKKIIIYSLIGKSGGELKRMSDEQLNVASFETSHIQEAHIVILHSICMLLDELAIN